MTAWIDAAVSEIGARFGGAALWANFDHGHTIGVRVELSDNRSASFRHHIKPNDEASIRIALAQAEAAIANALNAKAVA